MATYRQSSVDNNVVIIGQTATNLNSREQWIHSQQENVSEKEVHKNNRPYDNIEQCPIDLNSEFLYELSAVVIHQGSHSSICATFHNLWSLWLLTLMHTPRLR